MGLGPALCHQRRLASGATRSLGRRPHLQRPHPPARRQQQCRAPACRSRSHGRGTAGNATVSVDYTLGPGKTHWCRAQRAAPAGVNRVVLPIDIANPSLWYPAGYGAQPIYKFKTRLKTGQATARRSHHQDRPALHRPAPRARPVGTLLRVHRQRHPRLRQGRRRHSLRQLPHPRHHASNIATCCNRRLTPT